MRNSAYCWQDCAIAAGTIWAMVGMLAILLVALIVYVRAIAKRRVLCHEEEIQQPVETGLVKDEEAAGETQSIRQRLESVENADLEDPSRMQEIGDEIAAMAMLSSEYRSISTRRRYLSRKIFCNTVGEVSRRHMDPKSRAVFAGSAQEVLGDTLQQIKYFQASKERKYLGDIERGLSEEYAKQPMFNSDLDVVIVPLAVCIGPNDDLEYNQIPSKPLSFVKLKLTAKEKLGYLRECLTESGYLTAKAVKQLVQETLERAKYVYCGSSLAVAVEEHGVAVEIKWAEPSVDAAFFKTVLIVNFTFALCMPDWPRCALSWTERVQNWSSRHLTAAIAASLCHAVAFYRDSSDDECQWRLSFPWAELILFSSLPPHARGMCIALRTLFKSGIQPYCPSLSSYHLKTVIRWIVEQAPSKILSSRDSTAVALVKSIALLNDYVRDGCLPHYFVSGHNILPVMSQCEVKEATDVILDAAFYSSLHLTRLRASEAKYIRKKDYLLVLLPGETWEPESVMQYVIMRQLNDIMSAIPDAFEEVPLTIPRNPVLVHLLTGRVVKLAFHKLLHETCFGEYNEILMAAVQDNVELANSGSRSVIVEANFEKAFVREFFKGLVHDTERSLVNSRCYVSKVKEYRTVRKWILVVAIALFFGVIGGAGLSIAFCTCDDASWSAELSQTNSSDSSSSSSNTYYGGGQSLLDVHGEVPQTALDGAIRVGTKILTDVNVRSPFGNYRLSHMRG